MGYEALACYKKVACFNISNVNPNWYKSRNFFNCENFPKGSKKMMALSLRINMIKENLIELCILL